MADSIIEKDASDVEKTDLLNTSATSNKSNGESVMKEIEIKDDKTDDEQNAKNNESVEFSSEDIMSGDGEILPKSDLEVINDDDHEMNEDNVEIQDEDDDEDKEEAVDPNMMPQVNVTLLAKRNWQIRVYPLKCGDFMSGQIGRALKYAKESLMYILSPGRKASGKGEMYVSSAENAARVVHNLMKLDFQASEVNIEIFKKGNDNEVEERGHIRFDTKLVRMLCIPNYSVRKPGFGNRKFKVREIGSVFVKNISNKTSKEMLRVLFPFSTEINYNPEKFKDCTARLVLDKRAKVVPCLKAFAKVEVGGNILELHPLERRKGLQKPQDKERPVSTERKEREPSTSQGKSEDGAKKEMDEKKDVKPSPVKKEVKVEEGKNLPPKKSSVRDSNSKERMYLSSRRRSGLADDTYDKRKPGTFAVKPSLSKPETSSRDRFNRSDRRGPLGRDSFHSHSPRGSNRGFRGGSGTGNYTRSKPNWSSRAAGSRKRIGSSGDDGLAGSSRARRFEEAGFGGSMAGGSGDMGLNAGATREMMLLQNQLSMAIKNQLSMLNQTQLAIEQAKRTAVTELVQGTSGSSIPRPVSGTKRRANQAFSSEYDEEAYSIKRQGVALAGQRSWAEETEDYYSRQPQHQSLDYDAELQGSSSGHGYGSAYSSRNFNYDQSHYSYY